MTGKLRSQHQFGRSRAFWFAHSIRNEPRRHEGSDEARFYQRWHCRVRRNNSDREAYLLYSHSSGLKVYWFDVLDTKQNDVLC